MVHFLKQAAFSEIEVKIDMCTLYSVDCVQVFDRHIQYSEYCYFLVVQYLRNYWDKHIATKLPPPPTNFHFPHILLNTWNSDVSMLPRVGDVST